MRDSFWSTQVVSNKCWSHPDYFVNSKVNTVFLSSSKYGSKLNRFGVYSIVAMYRVHIRIFIKNVTENVKLSMEIQYCSDFAQIFITKNILPMSCNHILCKILRQWLGTVWIHSKSSVMSSWPEKGESNMRIRYQENQSCYQSANNWRANNQNYQNI